MEHGRALHLPGLVETSDLEPGLVGPRVAPRGQDDGHAGPRRQVHLGAPELAAGAGEEQAGGLGPDNVALAIERTRPAGVDSETHTSRADDRRRKDPERVRLFLERARAARV
jgi:hypothetical protein